MVLAECVQVCTGDVSRVCAGVCRYVQVVLAECVQVRMGDVSRVCAGVYRYVQVLAVPFGRGRYDPGLQLLDLNPPLQR